MAGGGGGCAVVGGASVARGSRRVGFWQNLLSGGIFSPVRNTRLSSSGRAGRESPCTKVLALHSAGRVHRVTADLSARYAVGGGAARDGLFSFAPISAQARTLARSGESRRV